MLLDENNYKEQIHAFTQQDWHAINFQLAFRAVIRHGFKSGTHTNS